MGTFSRLIANWVTRGRFAEMEERLAYYRAQTDQFETLLMSNQHAMADLLSLHAQQKKAMHQLRQDYHQTLGKSLALRQFHEQQQGQQSHEQQEAMFKLAQSLSHWADRAEEAEAECEEWRQLTPVLLTSLREGAFDEAFQRTALEATLAPFLGPESRVADFLKPSEA